MDDKGSFADILPPTPLTVDETFLRYKEVGKFENIDEDTPVAVETIR